MEKLTQTNYVDLAEDVIVNKLERNKSGKFKLTNSKIRNLLSLVNNLYNDVVRSKDNEEQLTELVEGKIQYLRLRFVYEAGRELSVKDFITQADIINHLQRIGTRSDLLLFCRYMEALVAYHKFNGGRD